jgi:hypothetical protein
MDDKGISMADKLMRDGKATVFEVREAVNISGSTPHRYPGLGGAPLDLAARRKTMPGKASAKGRVRGRRLQIG